MEETNWAAGRLLFWVSVALGYIKPIAVTCIALWLCLTLARSVTICHQFTYSHTHTHSALLGNEKGGCAGGVRVCASTSANSLGEEACIYNWEGGIVCEGGLFSKEMERSFWWRNVSACALGCKTEHVCEMMLWVCCWHGDKKNFYFSNSFHFKGIQEFHKLYTNSSASEWQEFFSWN